MKVLGIILFVLTAWLVWIIGKPRNIKLIDQEYESRLERVMPDNVVDGNRVTTYTSFEPMFNQMLYMFTYILFPYSSHYKATSMCSRHYFSSPYCKGT